MSPTTLEVMMMLPPSGTWRAPCLTTWKAPSTWTARTRAKTSDGYSAIGATAPLMPALLKRTSKRPWRSAPASSARLTASSSATSATTLDARSSPSSSTAAASRSASMPTRWTFAPSATHSRAVASPIPLSPPVMSTTLSASLAMARTLAADGAKPLDAVGAETLQDVERDDVLGHLLRPRRAEEDAPDAREREREGDRQRGRRRADLGA